MTRRETLLYIIYFFPEEAFNISLQTVLSVSIAHCKIIYLIMKLHSDALYHIYNRGNNSQKLFFTESNYLFLLSKIRKELTPYGDILCYCLMPNHFHLIIHSHEIAIPHQLNNAIGILLRSYTRAINRQEHRTGSLFQQKTKAKELNMNDNNTVSYLVSCAHYIHQNPIKAGLTKNLSEWKFSSYLDFAGLRNGTLCNQELFFKLSGMKKDDFIKESETMLDFRRNAWKASARK